MIRLAYVSGSFVFFFSLLDGLFRLPTTQHLPFLFLSLAFQLFLLRFLAVYTLCVNGNSGALQHLVVQFILSAELCLKRVGSRNVNRRSASRRLPE